MQSIDSAGAAIDQRTTGNSPRVLLCGRSDALEFHPVRTQLARQLPDSKPDLLAPSQVTQSDAIDSSDLVIVCESHPDEFTAEQASRLLARAVSSRLIVCTGEWCISEGRTRSLWPAAVRVSVDRFATRLQREIGVYSGKADPIPLTAAANEIFAIEAGNGLSLDQTVQVHSPDPVYRETLETALQSLGCRVLETGQIEPLDAILFDIDPWERSRAAALRSLRAQHTETRIIILTSFPGASHQTATTDGDMGFIVGKASGIEGISLALVSEDVHAVP